MQIAEYNSIVITPDAESRMRVKAATSALLEYNRVFLADSFRKALERLGEAEDRIHLVFISSDFPSEQITNFIEQAKEIPMAAAASKVLLLKVDDQNGTYVARNFISGIDGFLAEPFSVDGLKDVTNLVQDVEILKAEKEKKQTRTLGLLLDEAIPLIDRAAKHIANEIGYRREIAKLRATTRTLKELGEDRLEEYALIAAEKFGSVPIPEPIVNQARRRAATEAFVAKRKAEREERLAEENKVKKDDSRERYIIRKK